jgi:hypothetical protein
MRIGGPPRLPLRGMPSPGREVWIDGHAAGVGWRRRFLQIKHSLGDRTSAERVLPTAQERGIAVMINRPFAGGRLFGAVGDGLPCLPR